MSPKKKRSSNLSEKKWKRRSEDKGNLGGGCVSASTIVYIVANICIDISLSSRPSLSYRRSRSRPISPGVAIVFWGNVCQVQALIRIAWMLLIINPRGNLSSASFRRPVLGVPTSNSKTLREGDWPARLGHLVTCLFRKRFNPVSLLCPLSPCTPIHTDVLFLFFFFCKILTLLFYPLVIQTPASQVRGKGIKRRGD